MYRSGWAGCAKWAYGYPAVTDQFSSLEPTSTQSELIRRPGSVTLAGFYSQSIEGDIAQSFGSGLQMITVPAEYSGAALNTIFDSSPTLAAWDTLNGVYNISPNGLADTVQAGQGYWVRVGTNLSVISAGSGIPPSTSPFSVSLQTGWNLIGDPFTSGVELSNCSIVSGSSTLTYAQASSQNVIGSYLYTYDISGQVYQTLSPYVNMAPFTGYWLYASAPCTLVFP